MKRLVVITVVLASALLAGTAGAARSVFVSINAGGSVLRIKPASIHLVSNENLLGLHWRSWGGGTGTGVGRDHANSPSPGHSATNPVRVEATQRRTCKSRLVYTTVRVTFTKGVPYAGQPRVTKYAYGCPR